MTAPNPQTLDDAIWDAVVALTKLRIRIARNGDTLTDEQRKQYVIYLDQVVDVMAKWPTE